MPTVTPMSCKHLKTKKDFLQPPYCIFNFFLILVYKECWTALLYSPTLRARQHNPKGTRFKFPSCVQLVPCTDRRGVGVRSLDI